jgi:hypothetical protein
LRCDQAFAGVPHGAPSSGVVRWTATISWTQRCSPRQCRNGDDGDRDTCRLIQWLRGSRRSEVARRAGLPTARRCTTRRISAPGRRTPVRVQGSAVSRQAPRSADRSVRWRPSGP